jgi:hypothetical protein
MPDRNELKRLNTGVLRRKKLSRLRSLRVPADALPGSVSVTYRRCGKPSCHCAEGEGHPLWRLTFMVEGRKRVESIPPDWVEDVQRRVEEGRAFKEALAEVLTTNAELLLVERNARARKKKRK